MIRFFYTLLLTLASPFLLYTLYKKKQGKPSFGARWKEHFGFTPPLQGSNPSVKDSNPDINSLQKPIWIHAVSVGEVLGVVPLIKALKEKYPQQTIVLTTTTATGAEQANKLQGLVEHRYMPIDFAWTVRKFLNAIEPSQCIIMETELWPNTLATVHKRDIPITVINARLSERSARRYAKFQSVFNWLAANIDQILCQYQADAQRFIDLGVSPQKVSVTGSIKSDIVVDEASKIAGKALRTQLLAQFEHDHDLSDTSPTSRPFIWIAASTHKGEDEQVLTAYQQVLATYPNTVLILVPRHPERFEQVATLISTTGLTMHRRSDSDASFSSAQVYLGDSMGEMLALLCAADVCFMGGSLLGDKVGGHNLLEPSAVGMAAIIGPSFYNFAQITQDLIDAGAVTVCQNSQQLAQQLMALFSQQETLVQRGQQAIKVVEQHSGGIEATLSKIIRG